MGHNHSLKLTGHAKRAYIFYRSDGYYVGMFWMEQLVEDVRLT